MLRESKHIGLTFTADHIRLAQENRDSDAISKAIHYLTSTTSEDPIVSSQLASLRYCFLDDDASGVQAIEMLQQAEWSSTVIHYHETARKLVVWLSVIEAVRQHPAWADQQQAWFNALRQQLVVLDHALDESNRLDVLWSGVLHIAAGIVLDDDALFNRGTDIYRLSIKEYIHPEGYLKGIVDVHDAVDTYRLQLSGTGALVLMAEMAEHVGVDLWSIDNRGITPTTATAYLLYYYYYPEKWKWDNSLTNEITETIIKSKGAFIEIVNRRAPLRGADIFLDDLRPLFGMYCGGLTTLTHGIPVPQKKKRWGLFGS